MFDLELTKHLAELSKIKFSTEELSAMTEDMTEIIKIMDKVCTFKENVNPYELESVDYNDLRSDNHTNSSPTEDVIKNAHNAKNNSFVVPKVV